MHLINLFQFFYPLYQLKTLVPRSAAQYRNTMWCHIFKMEVKYINTYHVTLMNKKS